MFATVFEIFDLKCRDLENRVRGSSRSLEISPFDRAHMTSVDVIVTMALSQDEFTGLGVQDCGSYCYI